MRNIKFFNGAYEVTQNISDTYPGIYLEFLANYLKTTNIRTDYEIFKDDINYDKDEMYQIPSGFEILLEIKDMTSTSIDANLSIGWVAFGLFNSIPVVIEQNASPLIVYYPATV